MKRAEREREKGCARAEEQVFRTCELMPSCPVAEAELRVETNFSTFSGAKDKSSGAVGCDWERVCSDREG